MKLWKITAAIAFLALSATTFAGPILRTNEIRFLSDVENIVKISFLVHRHSVTRYQPFETKDNTLLPATPVSPGETRMEILSGRNRSYQVYNDLVDWGFSPVSVPGKMNFAVEGTFMFRLSQGQMVICENVALSQALEGLGSNLWYVFSRDSDDMHSDGRSETRLNCHTEKGLPYKVLISAGRESYKFIVGRPWPGSWDIEK